jgi:hypothetical protein
VLADGLVVGGLTFVLDPKLQHPPHEEVEEKREEEEHEHHEHEHHEGHEHHRREERDGGRPRRIRLDIDLD